MTLDKENVLKRWKKGKTKSQNALYKTRERDEQMIGEIRLGSR